MNNSYKKRERKTSEGSSLKNLKTLFVKQISAAIICTIVVFGMKLSPIVKFKEYAYALGNAARYETKTDIFKDLWEDIKNLVPRADK